MTSPNKSFAVHTELQLTAAATRDEIKQKWMRQPRGPSRPLPRTGSSAPPRLGSLRFRWRLPLEQAVEFTGLLRDACEKSGINLVLEQRSVSPTDMEIRVRLSGDWRSVQMVKTWLQGIRLTLQAGTRPGRRPVSDRVTLPPRA